MPPLLTPQQQRQARARAAEVRKARAELKGRLKAGTITLPAVLGSNQRAALEQEFAAALS